MFFSRRYQISAAAVLGLCLLAAAGCADLFSSGEQRQPGEVYYADFPDIPIPAEMELRSGNSQVIKTGNTVNGFLEFSGSVSWDSLVNACASNLTRDGWSVLGLFRGKHSLIIADKMDRTCVMTIYDGFPSTTLEVWVADKINGFIAPLATPERMNTNDAGTYEVSTGSSSAGGGGIQEQGLSE